MVWAPTTEDLLDRPRLRCDRFTWELLSNDEQLAGEIHPKSDRAPTITNDTTAAVPRSITGLDIPASEVLDINPVADRLRPVCTLQNGERFDLGVFKWSSDAQPQRPWGVERASSLTDKLVMLNQGTRTTLGWGKGADVGLIVVALVQEVFPLSECEIDPIDAELGVGISHPLGTPVRQILAEIMKLIGFLPPHTGNNGKLRLVDTPDMTTTDPALVYEAGGRIMDGTIAWSNTLLDAENVFRAYESSGQSQLVGEYRVPASAPHSVENIGYEVCEPQSVSGLKTQAQADKAARSLAVTRGATYRRLSLDSCFDPRHDTYDPVTALGSVWIEERQSVVARSGGAHSHVMRQVY